MKNLKVTLALTGWLLVSLICFGQALQVGDRVWAQWEPDDWYPGTLTEETVIGFLVLFDDGEAADCPAALIVVDRAPEADQVSFGTRVLAQWTDGWYYPGTVINDADAGTYDVLLDTRELVTVELTQLLLRGESTPPIHDLQVGDRVWAQWRPNDWYPGVLTEEIAIGFVVVFDDTADVPYVAADLPTSADIPTSLIVSDLAAEFDQVQTGTRVLARWSDDWFYPATVVSAAEAGIYNVLFDDRDSGTADLTGLRLLGE